MFPYKCGCLFEGLYIVVAINVRVQKGRLRTTLTDAAVKSRDGTDDLASGEVEDQGNFFLMLWLVEINQEDSRPYLGCFVPGCARDNPILE